MHLFLVDIAYSKVITVFINAMFAFSGSHVVIQLVEKYPDYFIVNLDKVLYYSTGDF